MWRLLFLLLFTVLSLSAADFSGKWAGELRKIESEADRRGYALPDAGAEGHDGNGHGRRQRDAPFDIENVKLESR